MEKYSYTIVFCMILLVIIYMYIVFIKIPSQYPDAINQTGWIYVYENKDPRIGKLIKEGKLVSFTEIGLDMILNNDYFYVKKGNPDNVRVVKRSNTYYIDSDKEVDTDE